MKLKSFLILVGVWFFCMPLSLFAKTDSIEEVHLLLRQKDQSLNLSEKRKTPEDFFSQKITLEEAIRFALENNSAFRQALQEVLISENKIREAKTIENPELSAIFFLGEKEDSTQLFPQVGLSHNLLDLYLARLRKRAASSELEVTKLQTAASAFQLITEVKKSFYELQALEYFRHQLREIVQSTQTAVALSERQKQAGNVNSTEVNTRQLIAEQAELELARNASEIERARVNLAQHLGNSDFANKITIEKRLPGFPRKEASVGELEELALANRLDLAALKQKESVFTREHQLARWQSFPSFRFGVEYERDPDIGTAVGPTMGFQIPVSGRGEVQKELVQIQRTQNQYAIQALENGIRAEVREAHAALQGARQIAARYQTKIIPLLSKNLKETQLEYNYMLKGVYDLLQISREQIRAQQEYAAALRDYWVARAKLEQALGTSFNSENLNPAKVKVSKMPKSTEQK